MWIIYKTNSLTLAKPPLPSSPPKEKKNIFFSHLDYLETKNNLLP